MRTDFQCDGCGYAVEVAGGPVYGSQVATDTFVCEGCRILFDVILAFCPNELGPLPDPSCDRCCSQAIRLWRTGDPCPRCGGPIKAGDGSANSAGDAPP